MTLCNAKLFSNVALLSCNDEVRKNGVTKQEKSCMVDVCLRLGTILMPPFISRIMPDVVFIV